MHNLNGGHSRAYARRRWWVLTYVRMHQLQWTMLMVHIHLCSDVASLTHAQHRWHADTHLRMHDLDGVSSEMRELSGEMRELSGEMRELSGEMRE